jgi:hypothetical protein
MDTNKLAERLGSAIATFNLYADRWEAFVEKIEEHADALIDERTKREQKEKRDTRIRERADERMKEKEDAPTYRF